MKKHNPGAFGYCAVTGTLIVGVVAALWEAAARLDVGVAPRFVGVSLAVSTIVWLVCDYSDKKRASQK